MQVYTVYVGVTISYCWPRGRVCTDAPIIQSPYQFLVSCTRAHV